MIKQIIIKMINQARGVSRGSSVSPVIPCTGRDTYNVRHLALKWQPPVSLRIVHLVGNNLVSVAMRALPGRS